MIPTPQRGCPIFGKTNRTLTPLGSPWGLFAEGPDPLRQVSFQELDLGCLSFPGPRSQSASAATSCWVRLSLHKELLTSGYRPVPECDRPGRIDNVGVMPRAARTDASANASTRTARSHATLAA
eukprot:Polyplicarium_translucidae@DN2222_c0_g1_i2.p3